MDSTFESDLAEARASLLRERERLLRVIGPLTASSFERGRRGHWTIGAVIQHVIESEWYYVRLIHHLRSSESPPQVDTAANPATGKAASEALTASRDAVLAAIDGIDEDSFYRLGGSGHQQYSVFSVLENVAMHDVEHADQVEGILARTSAGP